MMGACGRSIDVLLVAAVVTAMVPLNAKSEQTPQGWHFPEGCGGGSFRKVDGLCEECDKDCLPGWCEDGIGCSRCKTGFYTSSLLPNWPNSCEKCKIDNCRICADGGVDSEGPRCLECSSGYIPQKDGRACKRLPRKAQQSDCGKGYFLKHGNRCRMCDENCATGCKDWVGCSKCKDGYFTGKLDVEWPLMCMDCPKAIHGCAECVDEVFSDQPICKHCQPGFELAKYGKECKEVVEKDQNVPGDEDIPGDEHVPVEDIPGDVHVPAEEDIPVDENVPGDEDVPEDEPDRVIFTTFRVPEPEESTDRNFIMNDESTDRSTFIDNPPGEKVIRTGFGTRGPEEEMDDVPGNREDIPLEITPHAPGDNVFQSGGPANPFEPNNIPCDNNQFRKGMDGTCMDCDANCQIGQCEDHTGCGKCKKGFFRTRLDPWWPFRCEKCSEKVPNCLICEDGFMDAFPVFCRECRPGYKFRYDTFSCEPENP